MQTLAGARIGNTCGDIDAVAAWLQPLQRDAVLGVVLSRLLDAVDKKLHDFVGTQIQEGICLLAFTDFEVDDGVGGKEFLGDGQIQPHLVVVDLDLLRALLGFIAR